MVYCLFGAVLVVTAGLGGFVWAVMLLALGLLVYSVCWIL